MGRGPPLNRPRPSPVLCLPGGRAPRMWDLVMNEGRVDRAWARGLFVPGPGEEDIKAWVTAPASLWPLCSQGARWCHCGQKPCSQPPQWIKAVRTQLTAGSCPSLKWEPGAGLEQTPPSPHHRQGHCRLRALRSGSHCQRGGFCSTGKRAPICTTELAADCSPLGPHRLCLAP